MSDYLPYIASGVAGLLGLAYLYLNSQSENLFRDLKLIKNIGAVRRNLTKVINLPAWNIADFWLECKNRYGTKCDQVEIQNKFVSSTSETMESSKSTHINNSMNGPIEVRHFHS